MRITYIFIEVLAPECCPSRASSSSSIFSKVWLDTCSCAEDDRHMPKGKRAESRPELPETAKKPSITLPEASTAQQAEEFPTAPPDQEKFSVYLQDGKIAPGPMRESTQQKLRDVLKKSLDDPQFRDWAKLTSDPKSDELRKIAEAGLATLTGQALDVFAAFETLFISKKSGLTYEQVNKMLGWTPQEHIVLDAQGARCAAKYMPAAWLERIDLIVFLASIGMLTAIKIKTVADYVEQLKKAGQAPQPKREEPAKQEPAKESPGFIFGKGSNGSQAKAESDALEAEFNASPSTEGQSLG